MPPSDATVLLRNVQAGDLVAVDALYPLVYDELHRLAHAHMRHERAAHTLQTTGLVHEAYLKLIRQDEIEWRGRAQFFALAAKAMRFILVNYAKERNAQKRGGGARRVELHEGAAIADGQAGLLIDLDTALQSLATHHPRMAQVVECRYFGGMTTKETSEALDTAPRTVEREWTRARAYLKRALRDPAAPS